MPHGHFSDAHVPEQSDGSGVERLLEYFARCPQYYREVPFQRGCDSPEARCVAVAQKVTSGVTLRTGSGDEEKELLDRRSGTVLER